MSNTILVQQSPRGDTRTEQVSRWVRLEGELRLLCRSLRCSWCDSLLTVSTVVNLPDDPEFEQAVRAICQRLAAEYGMQQMVWRENDAWAIRFTRLGNADLSRDGDAARANTRRTSPLLARLARFCQAFRDLHAPRLHGRKGLPQTSLRAS